MCGICGILGNMSRSALMPMIAAMKHRGPDDHGMFEESGIALGMTRLSILDLTSAGHQPMSNADGTVWIIYNGETYNFQQERALLEAKGHTFKSHSDTEVVLHLYEEYGDNFLLHMRGMFALAIYDKRKGGGRERLLLARDHMGIKPLLYMRVGSQLIFASEMKAMLASGLVPKEVDPESLRLLLTFGSILQPRTIIKGVQMLLPGHRLIVEGKTERLEKYWRLESGRQPELNDLPYGELVATVRASLEESVRLQMISDVPVGAFLSGGLDSSLLVALMSRMSDHKVRTFSVGFESEGADIDESDDAKRIANFIGTDHTRVVVTGQDVRERISRIVMALDQPSVDGVNSYFVSFAARQGVTVALSGTGGDEMFAGYPWFTTMVLADEKEHNQSLHELAEGWLSSIGKHPLFDSLVSSSLGRLVEKLRSSHGFLSRYARIYQIFGPRGTGKVLSSEMRSLSNVGREPAYDISAADELSAAPPLDRVSALCLRGYTQNQLLRDIDAVSMSHSLEVRVPYLDPAVADLSLSLPRSAKINDLSGLRSPSAATYRETGVKKILVDIGRDLLPQGLDLQQKRGFSMPFGAWMKGPLRDIVEDTLSPTAVKARGFFDAREVERLMTNLFAGKTGWPQPWLLMITELWCRELLDGKLRVRQHEGDTLRA